MSGKRQRNGDKACLSSTVALPRTVQLETGEVVDLPERLRWIGRALLPRMNAGLAALHTEAILDLALTWEQQAWPTLRPLMPGKMCPVVLRARDVWKVRHGHHAGRQPGERRQDPPAGRVRCGPIRGEAVRLRQTCLRSRRGGVGCATGGGRITTGGVRATPDTRAVATGRRQAVGAATAPSDVLHPFPAAD
jgi:hypothetical protein